MRGRGKRIWLLALVALAALPLALPAGMRARADNPVWRGMRVAQRSGCFACHSAPHNLEVANPASPFETIPSFAGGNLMMYGHQPSKVREWIRDGYTANR